MSVGAKHWALAQTVSGGSAPRVILFFLADWIIGDDQTECWPTIDVLAFETGMNRQTIMKATATLEKQGLIVKRAEWLREDKSLKKRVIYRLNGFVPAEWKRSSRPSPSDSTKSRTSEKPYVQDLGRTENNTFDGTKSHTFESTKNRTFDGTKFRTVTGNNKKEQERTGTVLTSTHADAHVDLQVPDWVINDHNDDPYGPSLLDLADLQDEGRPTESQATKKPYAGMPPCPVQKVVDLYHEVLPELPKIRMMTKAREAQIRARWKHICVKDKCTDQEQVLDIFRWMFEKVRKSPFLMGLTDKSENHRNWKCNLQWITKEENWAKIFDDFYLREYGL